VAVVLALAAAFGALREAGLFEVGGSMKVVDGDSLRRGREEIRLLGIDAPELAQLCLNAASRSYPCGKEAKRRLEALVGGNEVDCRWSDTDRYGRKLGTCSAGGRELNRTMVEEGWALAYPARDSRYLAEEAAARQQSRGLWRGTFDQPQAWRQIHRGRQSDAAGMDDAHEPD
jgi:endonuclease YncB( thermonuclease family)